VYSSIVLGIGQAALEEVFVSMASFAVLGSPATPATSVSFERLPVVGEIKLAKSKAMVLSPVESEVALPTFVLVPVFVGIGTTGDVVVPDPEPLEVPWATQGPVAKISIVPHVVSPAPVQAAKAKPVRTIADTDANRMIDSHNPKRLVVQFVRVPLILR
jgi:hypothetical protein